jgi:hypothetical protein
VADYAAETEKLWRSLSSTDLEFVAAVDSARLEAERQILPPSSRHLLSAPVFGLKHRYVRWETLVHKMEHDWGSTRYLIGDYVDDLTSRAELGPTIVQAPQDLRNRLTEHLGRLDDRFMRGTTDDSGAEFERWGMRRPASVPSSLWWRCPIQRPWDRGGS